MNDLHPYKHADEGEGSTHSVCNKHLELLGGKTTCCACDEKKDCGKEINYECHIDCVCHPPIEGVTITDNPPKLEPRIEEINRIAGFGKGSLRDKMFLKFITQIVQEEKKGVAWRRGYQQGVKEIINELESNPNPDGSINPNIQHWIEKKQIQLKQKFLAP